MRKLVGCSLTVGILAFSVSALGGTPKQTGTPTKPTQGFSLSSVTVDKVKTNGSFRIEPSPAGAVERTFYAGSGAATAGPTSTAFQNSVDSGFGVFANYDNGGIASDNHTLGGGFADGDTVVGNNIKIFRSSADPGNVTLADVFVCLTMGDIFQAYDTPGNGYGDGSCIPGTSVLYSGIPTNTVAVLQASYAKVPIDVDTSLGAVPRVWTVLQSNACRLGWRISFDPAQIGSDAPDDVWEQCFDDTGVGFCCNPPSGTDACNVAAADTCPNDATGSRGFCSDGVSDDCGLFFFGGPPDNATFYANIFAPAQGIFHMQPVACVGNTCSQVSKDRVAASKPGGKVIFDIMLSNWSTTPGVCDLPPGQACQRDSGCDEINGGVCIGGPERLQTWQATLSSVFATDSGGAPCDGVDLAGVPDVGYVYPQFPFDVDGALSYSATQACTNNAQCAGAFGTGATCTSAQACNFAGLGANDPACDVNNFAGWDSVCTGANTCTRVCKPGFQNTLRADWVHHDIATVAAVDTGSCNYRYGSTMGDPAGQQGPYTDTTKPKVYGGSLVLDMSANAKGEAIVDFDHSGFNSFMIDQAGPNIPLIGFEPGYVEVTVGSCCYNLGPGTSQCTDGKLENECNAQPTTNVTIWTAGALCAGDNDADGDDDSCPSCTSNADCAGFDGDGCTADTCVDFVCTATPIVCDDGNVCTTDTCDPAGPESTTPKDPGTTSGACVFTNNSDPCDDGLFCNGADTCDAGGCGLHAGDPCTDGLGCTNEHCDEATDSCVDDPDVNCDDGIPCTYDSCVEPAGTCSNVDINTIPCDETGSTDTDCLLGGTQYDCNGLTCVCVTCPEFEVGGGGCYDAGVKLVVPINKTAGAASGAQIAITYDPNCLQFQSITPGVNCGGVAFGMELYEQSSPGSIFYAVGVALGQGNERVEPDVLACINFARLNTCANCSVCVVEGTNPYDTRFTNAEGQDPCLSGHCQGLTSGCTVDNNTCPAQNCVFNHCEYTGELCDALNPCGPRPCINGPELPVCSGLIGLNRVVELTVPDGAKVNSDCDHNTANVSWDPPSATSTCGDDVSVVCSGTHESGYVYPDDVVQNGGELAQGTNVFCCTATGEGKCPGSDEGCWTVEVNDQTTLDVVVQLSPLLATKPAGIERCIEFEAWSDCVQAPITFCRTLTFGGLFDLTGHFTDTLKIPKGQFSCLTARDKSHTLRSCAYPECVGGILSAVYKGDPFFGGNWLIGGNLDAWKKSNPKASHDVIDILDFGSFISQYLKSVPQDTPCPSTGCHDISGTHADINGDGIVDLADFTFISMNFLESSKDCCCPGSGAAAAAPLTSVSVEELRAWDMADLSVADLNRDGFVDMDDMSTFMQGGGPIPKDSATGVKGSSVRPSSGGSR